MQANEDFKKSENTLGYIKMKMSFKYKYKCVKISAACKVKLFLIYS